MRDIWWTSGLITVFPEYFVMALTVSFHQHSIFHTIYILLLLAEQMNDAWETSKFRKLGRI